MQEYIDLSQLNRYTDAVRAAVEQLESGHVIAIPDEVGVLLLGLPQHGQAANELATIAQQIPEAVAVLELADWSVLPDYTQKVSKTGSKLARRCWPGPVALRMSNPCHLASEAWAESAKSWATNEFGRLYTVPGHSFAIELLGELNTPPLGLVVNMADQEKIPEDKVSLIVQSDSERYEEGLTIVQLNEDSTDNRFEIERNGVVSDRVLSRLTGEFYLFVCTGNTCRSPMAEALFRRMLAEHLKCQEDELLDHGYAVISAGLAAYPGSPASQEAVDLLKRSGIDLTSHESQPVSRELLLHCDHILTMTQNHLDSILNAVPELASQARMLSLTGKDVSDPIGGGAHEYELCCNEIESHLVSLLP